MIATNPSQSPEQQIWETDEQYAERLRRLDEVRESLRSITPVEEVRGR